MDRAPAVPSCAGGTTSPQEHRIELAPHCSLSRAGARRFVISVAATTAAVAGICSWHGFWPVLPFAGAEIALLVWAVGVTQQRARLRERITISYDSVLIETSDATATRRSVFPRHWAKVKLRVPQAALYPSRLMIESHGRAREVGRFLTEAERRALAARLKTLVGNVDESPSLG